MDAQPQPGEAPSAGGTEPRAQKRKHDGASEAGGVPPVQRQRVGASSGRGCVEWAAAPALCELEGGVEDPLSAADAEALIDSLAVQWKAVRAVGDGVSACRCGCNTTEYLPRNSGWFQRASEQYRDAFAHFSRKGHSHAHTQAYQATRKKFPDVNGLHFGAIPGIAPGYKLLSKAHAAAIGVHRAIYKGMSVRRQQGTWAPVESITLSGGYKDDEDNGLWFWYTGEGGQDQTSREQVYNQRLRANKSLSGNQGLAINCAANVPVRVIRKQEGEGYDGYVYDGLYDVVEWKRVPSKAGPVVMQYKMVRLSSEKGAIGKAVQFHKTRGKYAGQLLASSMRVHGHGQLAIRAQRQRRKEVASSPHVISNDISGGHEKPFCVCCFNDTDKTRPPPLEYLTRSEPVKTALKLLGPNLDGAASCSAAVDDENDASGDGHGGASQATAASSSAQGSRAGTSGGTGPEGRVDVEGGAASQAAAASSPSTASAWQERKQSPKPQPPVCSVADPDRLVMALEATGIVSGREVACAVAQAKAAMPSEEPNDAGSSDTASATHGCVVKHGDQARDPVSAAYAGAPSAAASSDTSPAAASQPSAQTEAGQLGEAIDLCKNCPALNRNRHPETGEVWVPYNRDRCLLRVCDAVFECGPDCPYGKRCIIKLVQHGLPRDLEIFKTREKGWGVRCWHKIFAGDFISEYVGEILTIEDSEERENDEYFFDCRVIPAAARKDGLYTMTDGDSALLNKSGSEFLIDGRTRGNVTRYINHSCEPNLIVQCVFIGNERLPRICLFAWKDIEPGEELCYDYAQEQNSAAAPFQCNCGAPKCKSQTQGRAATQTEMEADMGT